jgi:hypothetical protein
MRRKVRCHNGGLWKTLQRAAQKGPDVLCARSIRRVVQNWRMQTLDFTRALTDIVAELKVRELYLLLQGWLITMPPDAPPNYLQQPVQNQLKESFTSLLFESHAGYDRLMRVDTTRKILEGMEAKELYGPARLGRLMQLVSNSTQLLQLRGGNNPEVFDFYETLRSFLKMEKTCRTLLEQEKIGEVPATDKIIELQLTDYEGKGVEPERLSVAFAELADLQMNIARLLRVADHRLTVKYLDSGTDFKIGLEGAREAIDAMRALFLQFWDKIRFRDQDTFEKDIEALSKGLEFLAKTKEAVDSGAITAEEAGNLKARVFRGVNDLVGLGVTLPLKGETAAEERKQLVERRSTKLLIAGDDAQLPEPEPPHDPNLAA